MSLTINPQSNISVYNTQTQHFQCFVFHQEHLKPITPPYTKSSIPLKRNSTSGQYYQKITNYCHTIQRTMFKVHILILIRCQQIWFKSPTLLTISVRRSKQTHKTTNCIVNYTYLRLFTFIHTERRSILIIIYPIGTVQRTFQTCVRKPSKESIVQSNGYNPRIYYMLS